MEKVERLRVVRLPCGVGLVAGRLEGGSGVGGVGGGSGHAVQLRPTTSPY